MWGQHIQIIDKCGGDIVRALFYVRKTVENGWSRNVLAVEIAGDLYARQGKAVTNFALTMPAPDSDLAQQLTKAPLHLFGFSDYELLRKVSDDFKSQLPTIEEIESELANMEKGAK